MASLIYNHGSYYAVFSYGKNKKWIKIGKLDKKQAKQILKQLEIEWAKDKLGLIEIKDFSLFGFKESVSAVESLCKLITKNKKTTLGQALDVIEREGLTSQWLARPRIRI